MSVRSRDPPGNRSVGDPFNRAFPIGIDARLTDEVALDLGTVAGDPIGPRGVPRHQHRPGIVDGAGRRLQRRRREPPRRGRELDAVLRTGIGL